MNNYRNIHVEKTERKIKRTKKINNSKRNIEKNDRKKI